MATTDPYLQYLQDYNAGITTLTTGGLQDKLQEKIQNTKVKKAMLLGLDDADTPLIEGIGELRETPIGLPTNTRYDAVELQHGSSPYNMYGSTDSEDANKKSIFAMATQRAQASRLLGVPEDKLTQQDMIDVGNQQQIQKLADLVRSPEEQRWEAPLIRGAVQTNLTGKYADEFGKPVDVPLNIPIGVELTGESDIYGRKLGSVFNENTGENITNTAATDRSQNAFAKASQKDIAGALSAGLNKAAEPTFIEEMSSLPGAVVSGVVKGGLGTADFITDLGQRATNKGFGTNFNGGLMEEDTINKIADTLSVGYDAAQDASSMQKANDSWSVAFKGVDITKPSTYKNVLDVESAKAAGNALLEYAKNPSLAAESLGQLAPGFGVKAVGQKIAQKTIEKYGSDTLKETMESSAKAYDELAALKANTTMDAIEKAEKVGEVTKKIDTLSKIGKTVSDAIPAVSYAASVTNQQMAEFKDNNNGVEMSTDRVLGTLVANTLAFAVPEIAATKVALGMNATANKVIADNVKGAVSKAFTTLAVGGITEVPQELVEGVVETVSTRLGTEKYKDKTVQEVVGEATAEIVGGALGGGVSGVHMATPKAANIVWNGGKPEYTPVDPNAAFTDADIASRFQANTEDTDVDTESYAEKIKDMSVDEIEVEKAKVSEWVAGKLETADDTNRQGFEDLQAMANTLYDNELGIRTSEVESAVDRKATQITEEESSLAEMLNDDTVIEELVISAVREYLDTTATEDVTDDQGNVARVYKAGIDENTVNEIASGIVKKFRVSGMDISASDLREEIQDELEARRQAAGVNIDGVKKEPKQYKGKVSDKMLVDNEALSEIYDSELDDELVARLGLNTENTKQTQQVLNKLRTDTLGGTRKVVDKLNEVGTTLKETIASNIEKYKANGVLKGDVNKVAGNLLRGATIGIGVINSSVVSDTELRQGLSAKVDTDEALLAKDEYYGSKRNIETQIGKEYANSYGIRVTGTPEQVLAKHRKIGRQILEVLIDSGIVEKSSSDIAFKLSENTVNSQNEGATRSTGTKNYATPTGEFLDGLSDEKVDTYLDTGIKLSDSSKALADVTGSGLDYRSETGDAVKRLNKLLKPSNLEVPSDQPNISNDIKVDPAVKLTPEAEKVIKDLRRKPFKVKDSMIGMLRHLKELRDASGGSLGKVLKNNPDLAIALNIETSYVPMLALSEKGSNNAKMDSLNGILDNLEMFEGEIYFDYQVDVNDRISVLQTVLNFQHDKVFSRQLLTRPNSMKYKSGSAAKEYMMNAVLEELGFSPKAGVNPKSYYKGLRKQLESGNITDEKLARLVKQAGMFVGKDAKGKLDSLAGLVTGKGFEATHKFRGQTFKLANLMEALNDVATAGSGDITTSFLVEMDASASGAFNTLINISGRNPGLFEKLLGKLGLHKADKDRLDSSDVYLMVGEEVYSKIMNADPEDASVAKYTRLQPIVKALENILGYNGVVRDLAKAPVMTWFYSAGDASITNNMVKSLIGSVFTEAVNGNKDAIAHIKEITDKDFRDIKPGSLEHKKLINYYKELGEVYTKTMTETFKDVTAYKDEMANLFNDLVENSKVNGKDYWGGVVRSASLVMNSEEENPNIDTTSNSGKVTPVDGTTNVYKMKEVISDLSAKEKFELGISDTESDVTLTTVLNNMPNATSVGPLTEQSKDAAELFAALDAINEMNPNGNGIVTVHDAMYGDVNELLEGREAYHKSVLKIAEQGDNIEGFLKAYDYTIAAMEADLNEAMSDKERKALVGRIKTLKAKAANMRAKNNPRIEAKKKLLAGTELEMFGMQKADRTVSGDVVSRTEIKDETPTEVEVESKSTSTELATIAKKILDSQPVFFDIESNISTDSKTNTVIELGFSNIDGTITEYFISTDGSPISKEVYLLGNTEEYVKSKGLQSYETYVSRFNKAKQLGQVVSLDDAVNSMLDAGNTLVGYNSSGFDIPAITKSLEPATKARLANMKTVDFRREVVQYTGDNRGTQSDLAKILGKQQGNHTSSEDAKALLEVVKGFSDSTMTKEELKNKVVIEKFKTSLKTSNVSVQLIAEILSWASHTVTTDLSKAKFITLSAFKANIPESLKGTDVSEITKSTGTNQRAWEVGGYVVLNDNDKSLFADPKQLASVLLHEIEHVVTKEYINTEMSKREKSPEITYLSRLHKVISGKPTKNLRANRLQGLDEQTFIEEIVAVYREDPTAFENVARELGIPGSRTAGVISRILKAVSKLIDGIIRNNGDVKVNLPNTVAALELLSTSGREFLEDTTGRVSGVDISDLEIKGCK